MNCPKCSSTNMRTHGWRRKPSGLIHRRMMCKDCGRTTDLPGGDAVVIVTDDVDLQCLYPGCRYGKLNELDLCGGKHGSVQGDGGHYSTTRKLVPNDGIVDFFAVECIATGRKVIPITWVEQDFAVLRMLRTGGLSSLEIGQRIGLKGQYSGTQIKKFRRILETHGCP